MNKKISFVFVMLFSFVAVSAIADVTWTRVIQAPDKETVFRARPAKDGGSIVTGEVRSHGNVDGLVLKIAGDGTIEWQKKFDAGRPRVFVQGSSGSFLGFTYRTAEKLSSSGEPEWQRLFEHPVASVERAHGGGALVGLFPGELVWLDRSGNVLSHKSYSACTNYVLRPFVLRRSDDGGYFFAGEDNCISAANTEIFIVKVDAAGNLEWNRIIGTKKHDFLSSVNRTKDGGLLILFSDGNLHYSIFKLDSSGGIEWNRGLDVTGLNLSIIRIQPTKDGGFVILHTKGILKFDSLGNIRWHRLYEVLNESHLRSLVETRDRGFIIVGDVSAGKDVLIFKVDKRGRTSSSCVQVRDGATVPSITIPFSTDSLNIEVHDVAGAVSTKQLHLLDFIGTAADCTTPLSDCKTR